MRPVDQGPQNALTEALDPRPALGIREATTRVEPWRGYQAAVLVSTVEHALSNQITVAKG